MVNYYRVILSYRGSLEAEQKKTVEDFIRKYNGRMTQTKKTISIDFSHSEINESKIKAQIKKDLQGLEIKVIS